MNHDDTIDYGKQARFEHTPAEAAQDTRPEITGSDGHVDDDVEIEKEAVDDRANAIPLRLYTLSAALLAK